MTSKKTFLYIGGFELPDKNAAAHRVLANAKALNALGYSVIFLGITHDKVSTRDIYEDPKIVDLFRYYERAYPSSVSEWVSYSSQVGSVIELLEKYQQDIVGIIFYNYPAIAMYRLLRFCKQNSIRTISDCTEWYHHSKKTLLGAIKTLDTEMRMRFLNKSVDGLIAISRYLEDYYRKHVLTVYIPPLVDCEDTKWRSTQKIPHKEFTLVYAGSPGTKDRLDILVAAIQGITIPISLKIIGITKEQFHQQHPSFSEKDFTRITFLGRISHAQALSEISNAAYTCFFRDQARVTQAGFPTKFVESVTAGIPVITNASSNLTEYRPRVEACIIIDNMDLESVKDCLQRAFDERKPITDTTIFDYRNYLDEIKRIAGIL